MTFLTSVQLLKHPAVRRATSLDSEEMDRLLVGARSLSVEQHVREIHFTNGACARENPILSGVEILGPNDGRPFDARIDPNGVEPRDWVALLENSCSMSCSLGISHAAGFCRNWRDGGCIALEGVLGLGDSLTTLTMGDRTTPKAPSQLDDEAKQATVRSMNKNPGLLACFNRFDSQAATYERVHRGRGKSARWVVTITAKEGGPLDEQICDEEGRVNGLVQEHRCVWEVQKDARGDLCGIRFRILVRVTCFTTLRARATTRPLPKT